MDDISSLLDIPDDVPPGVAVGEAEVVTSSEEPLVPQFQLLANVLDVVKGISSGDERTVVTQVRGFDAVAC